MKVYYTKNGYFYKEYKNGKKKRISKKDYLKLKNKKTLSIKNQIAGNPKAITDSNNQISLTTNRNNNKVKLFVHKKYTLLCRKHKNIRYKMFVENKVFGVGVKNFRNFCDNEKFKISDLSCSTHPHNYYMQVLSELGLVGLSFILIILFLFIIYSLKHLLSIFRKNSFFNDFQIFMMSNILIFIWPIAPSGNFFNNWLNIIHTLPVIFLLWSIQKKPNEKK